MKILSNCQHIITMELTIKYAKYDIYKLCKEGLLLVLKSRCYSLKELTSENNKALEISCVYGRLIKYLIEKVGLTISNVRNVYNWPLRFSCVYGRLNIIKYLIEEVGLTKDDVISKDDYIYYWCIEKGHIDVLEYLEEMFGSIIYAMDITEIVKYYRMLKFLRECSKLTTIIS